MIARLIIGLGFLFVGVASATDRVYVPLPPSITWLRCYGMRDSNGEHWDDMYAQQLRRKGGFVVHREGVAPHFGYIIEYNLQVSPSYCTRLEWFYPFRSGHDGIGTLKSRSGSASRFPHLVRNQ